MTGVSAAWVRDMKESVTLLPNTIIKVYVNGRICLPSISIPVGLDQDVKIRLLHYGKSEISGREIWHLHANWMENGRHCSSGNGWPAGY